MCEQNLLITLLVIQEVKKHFPEIEVYLWTGYYYEELQKMNNPKVQAILDMIDVLIDGPYIESKRDVSLPLRGSLNQNIIKLKEVRK